MKHLVITRGALIAFSVCFLLVLVSFGLLWHQGRQLNDQQSQDKKLIDANAHTVTLVCKLATVFELNQPNLDPIVVQTLTRIINDLPRRCFP